MIAQRLQGVPSDAPAELAIVGMSLSCVIFAVYLWWTGRRQAYQQQLINKRSEKALIQYRKQHREPKEVKMTERL
jgi:hypothetical protein